MGLETGTYITDLVDTNPVAGDNLSQADDHLRLIKSCIQGTFNGFTGAATDVTEAQLAALAGGSAASIGRAVAPVYGCMVETSVQNTSSTSWVSLSQSGSFTENEANGLTSTLGSARFTVDSGNDGVYLLMLQIGYYYNTTLPSSTQFGVSVNGAGPAVPMRTAGLEQDSSTPNHNAALMGLVSLSATDTIEAQFRVGGTGTVYCADLAFTALRVA